MKVVLVTGSRKCYAVPQMAKALAAARPRVVIHGAGRGLDTWAGLWAAERDGVSQIPMPAQWDRHGKAAGPIRNRKMLEVLLALEECGHECEVHAFPIGESKGTRGMIEMAEKAGFDVFTHEGSEI